MKTSRKVGVGAASATAIAIAVSVVAPWEGLWLTAKPDRLAYNIPTVCYGETEGVRIGDTYTKSQCQAMLAKKLPRYDAEIGRCLHVYLPDKTRAALVSFAYNVGSAGACRSTAFKKINAGDIRGGCDALMAWNRAGGRVVKGLINRRTAERKLCLAGLDEPMPKPTKTASKWWWQK